jgi:cobalamin-dependent methionine synthase I
VLRSDVFRKRLAGLHPETRLAPAHYTRRSDQETYEALFESADDHLACGNCEILDAVFMSRSERDVAESLAHRARLPFDDLPAPSFLGRRVVDDVPLSEIVKYIDWTFFFTAWELRGRFPGILEHAEDRRRHAEDPAVDGRVPHGAVLRAPTIRAVG